jgi:hypothetical protein
VERTYTIPVAEAIRTNDTLHARAECGNVKVREANNEQNKRWQAIPYTLFSTDDLPTDTNHPILNAVLCSLFPNNTSLKTPTPAPASGPGPADDTDMDGNQHTPATKNRSGTIRSRPDDSTPATAERHMLENMKQHRKQQQQQQKSSATAANTSAAADNEALKSSRLNFNA